MRLTIPHSIREFCALEGPIIMFDKDENYAVLRLQEVRNPFGSKLPTLLR